MAAKYQYSKLVMEKFLRRSFYDAVLELYETSQGRRIISVSLEGNLTLVVNKDENFLIKLNEVAQRADDREDQLRYSNNDSPPTLKMEGFDQYGMKKEDLLEQFPHIPVAPLPPDLSTTQDVINEGLNHYKFVIKDSKEGGESSKLSTHFDNSKSVITKPAESVEGKIASDNKLESDSYEKSSETESESEEEGDIETTTCSQHNHHIAHSSQAESSITAPSEDKTNQAFPPADEICFVPEPPQFMDYNKRKFDYKEQELPSGVELCGKKSPHKKRKIIPNDGEEDPLKFEERDKLIMAASTAIEDTGSGGPQLLPHTATGPIIVEDEDNFNNGGITESQMAQLAMMQMTREPNMNMFRPQDLEELARQQQWHMVAYQRSIMEKSYLQHQMQQYQRDTERIRWEYVAQQARDYPQSGEEIEKAYKQATPNTNSGNSETPVLSNTSVLLDESKKNTSRENNMDLSLVGIENIPSQYMRLFSEDPNISQVDPDYEEGELRPEVHTCALCGTKFSTMDSLLRHMEKHRVAFERSCSVCQLGTLTGNMLILHMEASHGPDPNFPLPPSAPTTNTGTASLDTSVTPTVAAATATSTDYTNQFFSTPSSSSSSLSAVSGFTSLSEQPSVVTVKPPPPQPSQSLSSTQVVVNNNKEPPKSDTPDMVKSDMIPIGFSYTPSTAPSAGGAANDATASSSSSTSQENFLGIPSQFYPLVVCQVCGEKFALSEALDQHVEASHKDAALTYSCKVCALTFPKHAELSKHMAKHEPSSTNLKCSHCLKSFKSVKQLRLHYVAAHSCCHFCEYCRAGFPDAMALQLHEQLHTLDPDKLTFRCDICNKAFYTQSQCSAHKRTHKEEKAHICELCSSAFFKRGDLTKHTRTVHLPSRLFACKFCGKKGTRMDNMRSHVKSHHKNMSRDQIINMIEVIE